jgi:hypothetical protein
MIDREIEFNQIISESEYIIVVFKWVGNVQKYDYVSEMKAIGSFSR